MNRHILGYALRRAVGGCLWTLLIIIFVCGVVYLVWPHLHSVPVVVVVSATPEPTPTVAPPAVLTPLIPYGAYHGPSYSHLTWATMYTYKGTAYALVPGRDGRLWGDTAQDQLVLLYGARSQYQ